MSRKEKQLEKKIQALSIELDQVRENTILRCPDCNSGTKICKLVVSQRIYYDIDDWVYDNSYRVTCPKCEYVAHYHDEEDEDHKNFKLVKRLLDYFKSRTTYR